MQLATSPRTRALALAAMTAASTITGISSSQPAIAQEVQMAAATTQKCVQPTEAEIKKDVSGRKTAAFGVCVLQNSIAQDEASIARDQASIARDQASFARDQASIARDQATIDKNKAETQQLMAESECIDKATAALKSGYFDKGKLREFLGGKKPSEIGYCRIWNNRTLLAATQG